VKLDVRGSETAEMMSNLTLVIHGQIANKNTLSILDTVRHRLPVLPDDTARKGEQWKGRKRNGIDGDGSDIRYHAFDSAPYQHRTKQDRGDLRAFLHHTYRDHGAACHVRCGGASESEIMPPFEVGL